MLSSPTSPATKFRWPLLPLAALIATLPLIHHGYSCGHDFDFHIQSWLDAAQQMRHGTLDPHWTFSAAWNAGEPRFLFYPPLSWMLGALLTLIVPISTAPIVFTWLALTGAAIAMDRLAREFVYPNAALIAAAIYMANPYTLFTAYERTAYGELLAAVWLPLLLLAALRKRPTIPSIALPIALLWLTNAPAAVMGCYAFAVVIAIRLIQQARQPASRSALLRLLGISAGGALLGMALAGFYLLPAAYERRNVQIAMAIIPNMRYQDNFLFGHTADLAHNQVLHTASIVALILLGTTAAVLAFDAWKTRQKQPQATGSNPLLMVLALLTVLIGFLLTPLSSPFWQHMPELAFLQFPWRLLSILAVVLGLGIALLAEGLRPDRLRGIGFMLLFAVLLSHLAIHQFRQGCELLDRPNVREALFETHHGVEPTDEYTPGDADNDVLRTNNPAYWLAKSPADFASGTIPNPAATIVNYDTPAPVEQTLSGQTPMHFSIEADKPEFLILNLRNYPGWQITRTSAGEKTAVTQRAERDDGLIAFPVPAGASTVDIVWHRTGDQQGGLAFSLLGLGVLGGLFFRSHRQEKLLSRNLSDPARVN